MGAWIDATAEHGCNQKQTKSMHGSGLLEKERSLPASQQAAFHASSDLLSRACGPSPIDARQRVVGSKLQGGQSKWSGRNHSSGATTVDTHKAMRVARPPQPRRHTK